MEVESDSLRRNGFGPYNPADDFSIFLLKQALMLDADDRTVPCLLSGLG